MRVSRIWFCLLLNSLGLLLQQPLSAEHHKQCHCDQCVGGLAAPGAVAPAPPRSSSQVASMQSLVTLPEYGTSENQTFLVVNCPHEAEVRIDNFLARSTGPSRLFRLSFDKSNLPRRVQISFTTFESKSRTEYEYGDFVHCQPGKTTTISIKKEDMKTKRICESDCPKSSEETHSSEFVIVSTSKDDQLLSQLLSQLLADVDPSMSASVVQWDITRRLIAAKSEVAERSKMEVKSYEGQLKQSRAQYRQLLEAHAKKVAEATMFSEQASIPRSVDNVRSADNIRAADDLRMERLRLAAERRAEATVLAHQLETALQGIRDAESDLNDGRKKQTEAEKVLNTTLDKIKTAAHWAENSEASANRSKESANQSKESANQSKESANQSKESANQSKESANQSKESANQSKESANQSKESANQSKESANQSKESANQSKESAKKSEESAKRK